jgi:hypothetical protein
MYSFQLRYSEILGDPRLSQEALDASVDGLRKGLLTSILELGLVVLSRAHKRKWQKLIGYRLFCVSPIQCLRGGYHGWSHL